MTCPAAPSRSTRWPPLCCTTAPSSPASSTGPDRAARSWRKATPARRLPRWPPTAAVRGVASLPHGIPVETVGDWSSVDRAEIENLRSVRNILDEYVAAGPARRPRRADRCRSPSSDRPAPARPSPCARWPRCCCRAASRELEYDLSQLPVRRASCGPPFTRSATWRSQGDLALVFWDEFDAPLGGQPLGWLRHFLAPMADGRFREGAGFHPLGRAIFVFAGGTSPSFDAFVGSATSASSAAPRSPTSSAACAATST